MLRTKEVCVGAGVERREPLRTAGGNVNWRHHYREQTGGSCYC